MVAQDAERLLAVKIYSIYISCVMILTARGAAVKMVRCRCFGFGGVHIRVRSSLML